MKAPEELVDNSERLTRIFGYWPTFHDAEVIEFNLWRGDVETERKSYIFPTLTTRIHVWEITDKVDATGHYILDHQTIVTLRFHDLTDLEMADFNHQNAIFDLHIELDDAEGPQSLRRLKVEFAPAFGITAGFRCNRIEVLNAQSWPDGQ